MNYLAVDKNDPDTPLRVRRWRERCRREGRRSFIIVADEGRTWLEVSEHSAADFSFDILEPLFADRKYRYSSAGGGGDGGSFYVEFDAIHPPEELYRVVTDLIARGTGTNPGPGELPPDETVTVAEGSVLIESSGAAYIYMLDTGPFPQLRFSDEEYEVVSIAARSIETDGPILLADFTTSHEQLGSVFPAKVRLPEWNRGALEAWERNSGNYIWEPRFREDIQLLKEEIPEGDYIQCSRPGIEGAFAVLRYQQWRTFVGYLLLQRSSEGWKIVDRSYDADWDSASWELAGAHYNSYNTPSVPSFEEWSQYRLPYPCPPGKFMSPLRLEESSRIYEELCEGRGEYAQALQLPLVHGRPRGLVELLQEARGAGELYFNAGTSEFSEWLFEGGRSIVEFNKDSSPALGKLLAYWSRNLHCVRVDATFCNPMAADEEQQKALEMLSNIFSSSSISRLRFAATDNPWQDFFFQGESDEFGRSDQPMPFEHRGTVLLSRSSLMSIGLWPWRREAIVALCRWGDPNGTYTEEIMGLVGADPWEE